MSRLCIKTASPLFGTLYQKQKLRISREPTWVLGSEVHLRTKDELQLYNLIVWDLIFVWVIFGYNYADCWACEIFSFEEAPALSEDELCKFASYRFRFFFFTVLRYWADMWNELWKKKRALRSKIINRGSVIRRNWLIPSSLVLNTNIWANENQHGRGEGNCR
jgi:hypothetical protein